MTDSLLQSQPPARTLWADTFAPLVRDRRYLIAIFACLAVWAIMTQITYGLIDGPPVSTPDRATKFAARLQNSLLLFGMAFGLIRLLRFVRANPDTPLISGLHTALRANPATLLRTLILLILAALSFVWLQTSFMAMKTAIPAIQSFWFDDAARQMDLTLFRRDPWHYLGWMFDYPKLIIAIDRIYTNWAVLVAGFWVYALTTTALPRARRFQYIFASLALWFFVGNVAATLLSSVGPVYYGQFGGDPTVFAPSLAELHAIHAHTPLGAVDYADYLLHAYHVPETRFGGISAVPSLHIGSSLLMLALFWKVPLARAALIAFNLVIFVGSIILGWHYGVDGLIAAPMVIACWWIGGWAVKALDKH